MFVMRIFNVIAVLLGTFCGKRALLKFMGPPPGWEGPWPPEDVR